jgi:hypothetical protein
LPGLPTRAGGCDSLALLELNKTRSARKSHLYTALPYFEAGFELKPQSVIRYLCFVAKKKINAKKTIRVRAHPLHVPVSQKNPTGVTIRDAHDRNISALDTEALKMIFAKYGRSKIAYPSEGKLAEYPNADKYDDLIAVWCDHYNKQFPPTPPTAALGPNVMKALIASESDFRLAPPNPKAIGIAQITPATWKIVQDQKGELKDHFFKNFLKKDLKVPDIAIPIATRWIFRKRELARQKLKREPTSEEIILEYKGLLRSSSTFKQNALAKFKDAYDKLNQQ